MLTPQKGTAQEQMPCGKSGTRLVVEQLRRVRVGQADLLRDLCEGPEPQGRL